MEAIRTSLGRKLEAAVAHQEAGLPIIDTPVPELPADDIREQLARRLELLAGATLQLLRKDSSELTNTHQES